MSYSDPLIAVILLFIWCWDYPADHPAKKFIRRFSFPFVYIGLWHSWAMFAPEPIRVNRRLRAVMRFADGTETTWGTLAPDGSHKLINALLARSFKFEHSVLGAKAGHLHAPLCSFLCRQAVADGYTPVLLELWRDFKLVQPYGEPEVYGPGQSFLFYSFDPQKRTGQAHTVKSAEKQSPVKRTAT